MSMIDWSALGQGLANGASALGRGVVRTAENAVNRTGEMAYDVEHSGVGQAVTSGLHSAAVGLGLISDPPAPVDVWAQRGFPMYMTNANPDASVRTYEQNLLGRYDPKTLPQTMSAISGYRADTTHGGLETLPLTWTPGGNQKNPNAQGGPAELYATVRALAHAQQYGVPQLSAAQLAAMALKEGRTDLGTLTYDFNNPKSDELYKHLAKDVGRGVTAEFPVLVQEKSAVAKRLGIPFEEAWNGTGSNGHGSTGAAYARAFPAYMKAAADPKNAALVAFIQSALDAEKPKKK